MAPGRWLAVVGAVAMLVGAAATVPVRHLWEPDEPRYAEVAREMLATGRWAVPRLNGEPYAHKPPLYMWAEATGRACGLGWTAAGVLPSILPFLALLALLPAMAKDLDLGADTGWLAAGLLAASPMAATMALAARMDMLLALLNTMAIWLLFKLTRVGVSEPQRRLHLAFWLVLALGVLTKGPVALALPAGTLMLMLVLVRPRPSARPVLAGWGPVLFVAAVLAWIVPAVLSGGRAYAEDILVRQSVGRVVQSFAHQRPFYYHLVTYPLTGLPFSVAVFVAVFHGFRRGRHDGIATLAAGVATVLGFFSLISGKLVVYLLPLFPLAALLVAHTVRSGLRGTRTALMLGGIITAAVGAAIASAPYWRPEVTAWRTGLLLAGTIVVLLALTGLAALVRGRSLVLAATLLALSGLAFPALVLPVAVGALDGRMSVAAEAAEVRRLEPDNDRGLAFRADYAGLPLYAERLFTIMDSDAELVQALRDGRVVVMPGRSWTRLEPSLAPLLRGSSDFAYGSGSLLVLQGAVAKVDSEP